MYSQMSHVANKVGGEQQNVQNNAFIQQQQALNQNINSTKTVNKTAENDSKTGLIKEDGKQNLSQNQNSEKKSSSDNIIESNEVKKIEISEDFLGKHIDITR